MNVFDDMLAAYAAESQQDKLNAIHEVMQQVALGGLARSGFFKHAAFYGGTCLRIFHGLPRFSEDLDFSLLTEETGFCLDSHFDTVVQEFAMMGQVVTLESKKKTRQSHIKSAFLKSDTVQYDLHLERGRSIKIKLEVDTVPPPGFSTEQRLLLQPYSFYTRCYTLPSLFAGKMHALMYRAWQNRVKGRDWYDFEWYVRRGVPLDFPHFKQRAEQTGAPGAAELTPETFRQQLRARLAAIPIHAVKEDVYPFVRHPQELEIWSTDYFCQLAAMVRIQE